jgi:hypothetical protein
MTADALSSAGAAGETPDALSSAEAAGMAAREIAKRAGSIV